MSTETATGALIIGAGIGGLAAALALRQAGIEVSVRERAATLESEGAGLTLWANAMAALDRLGVADRVAERGAPVTEGCIRTASGDVLTRFSAKGLRTWRGAVSVGILRGELRRALLDALPSGTVCAGEECVEIAQDALGVEATFADASRARAALLLGADGLRSRVRSCLFGKAAPRYAGYTAWRGVVESPLEKLRPGETWGCGLRFGQVALGDGWAYWFAVANLPEGMPESQSGRKRDVLERFTGWHEPIPALIAATAEDAILRNDIYDRPPLRRWGRGRVTLLGDAAHPMTPNLGHGACQAIEDAVVLGRCLRAVSDDLPAALERYAAERRRRTARITRQSRLLGWVAQWENRRACLLRDALVRGAPAWLMERQLSAVIGTRV